MMSTSLTISQNIDCNDSLYQLKLSLIINDNITMKKVIESMQKQLSTDSLALQNYDSDLKKAENQISNLERQVFNSDAIITNLNKQIALTQESGLRWYHYAGGGVLCAIIGILTGLLIK